MENETITFNGITFRRYPDAKQWADRVYFVPGISDRQRGTGRLHEEVWKARHGGIPAGCEIHHHDGDPLNNRIENLRCVSREEHRAWHNANRKPPTPETLARLDAIRPKAAEWHQSPEGRAWHSATSKRMWSEAEVHTHICDQCGAEYKTRLFTGHDRFCSNACKTASRRQSRVDDVQRTCAYCGAEFTVNKYNPKQCCNRTCAQRLRRDQAN